MTATVPDTVVAEYLADKSLGLSILNLGDPTIHRSGLEFKEYYSLTYPGLTKQVHFVNPHPVAGNKDAIITVSMAFQIVPKSIGKGQNISLGVLRTNNPLWIKVLDDLRDNEIAESGVASVLTASEMLEATKSASQRMADEMMEGVNSTSNALIKEHKKQILSQEQEIAKLKAQVRRLAGEAADNLITKPSPVDIEVDPDVDLDAVGGSDLAGDEDEVPEVTGAAASKLMKPAQPEDEVELAAARARAKKRK